MIRSPRHEKKKKVRKYWDVPLPGFEHNQTHRAPGKAVAFEGFHHAPLPSVEAERHDFGAHLVFDARAGPGPVVEIVAAS